MRLSRILTAASLALALTAAGCGGDDGDDDGGGGSSEEAVKVGEAPASGEERAVATAIRKWAGAGNTTEKCGGTLTPRLVTEIYGSRDACLKAADDNPAPQIKAARVGDVSVQGDTATARLSTRAEGVAVDGPVRVVRQGGTWRIDDFGTELLRDLASQLQELSFTQLAEQSEDKQLPRLAREVGLGDCIDEGLGKLPEDQLRESLVKSIGLGDSSKRIGRITAGCVTGSESGRRLLRLNFEINLRAQLPAKSSGCVIAAVRKSAGDDLIAAVGGQVFSGIRNAPRERELQAKLRTAAGGCGVKLG